MSITGKRVTASDKKRENRHASSRVGALKSLPFAKKSQEKSDQNQTRQHIYNQCHSENVQPVTAGRGKVAKAVVSDVGFRHAMDLCKREVMHSAFNYA